MKFQVTHTYQRPVAEVFAALSDADRVREKYEALGHTGFELITRVEAPDGEVTLVTRRVVPLQLPGFARRVLSPRQSVTQTDVWSAPDGKGVRTGSFDVTSRGTPVRLWGTMRLAPEGTRRCSNVIDVTVECSLPLIGGRIADLVAADTRRALDHEQTWTSELLHTH